MTIERNIGEKFMVVLEFCTVHKPIPRIYIAKKVVFVCLRKRFFLNLFYYQQIKDHLPVGRWK